MASFCARRREAWRRATHFFGPFIWQAGQLDQVNHLASLSLPLPHWQRTSSGSVSVSDKWLLRIADKGAVFTSCSFESRQYTAIWRANFKLVRRGKYILLCVNDALRLIFDKYVQLGAKVETGTLPGA